MNLPDELFSSIRSVFTHLLTATTSDNELLLFVLYNIAQLHTSTFLLNISSPITLFCFVHTFPFCSNRLFQAFQLELSLYFVSYDSSSNGIRSIRIHRPARSCRATRFSGTSPALSHSLFPCKSSQYSLPDPLSKFTCQDRNGKKKKRHDEPKLKRIKMPQRMAR